MGLVLAGDFAKFKRDISQLKDLDKIGLAKKIGEALVSSTQARFETQKGPDGAEWPVSHRAANTGGQTLSDTGRLKNSISYHATAQGVEVGTNVKYAHVHQNGAVIKPKKAKYLRFRIGTTWARKKLVTLPPRPFIGISDADVEEIDGTIMDHLNGRLS